MIDLNKFVDTKGFRGCFLLEPAPFLQYQQQIASCTLHQAGMHLVDDPIEHFPWVNAILLLIYPYQPFAEFLGVSGYYPASNAAYHSAEVLCTELKNLGIHAERIHIPVRELILRHGIGIACRNGLTAIPPFGTRFVAQTLALHIPDDMLSLRLHPSYDVDSFKRCPPSCKRCIEACPSQAINHEGMMFQRCIRGDMEGNLMKSETMQRMSFLLGCEHCQFVCPLNESIEQISQLPPAFDLKRLLSGDIKDAIALIGKNMRSGGRLEQHALIMAAKQHRTDLLPLMEEFLNDPRPQIVQAAEYAISVLHNQEE